MESIYRTLFFCQKVFGNYKIFYGHSIHWKLTDLDYFNLEFKKKNIHRDMYVFFVDLPSRDEVDQLIKNKNLDIHESSKKYNLTFEYEQEHEDFLSHDASINEYNPFISLCSKANYYFSIKENDFIENFIQEKKEAINKFENEFLVPLMKNPHLLCTFAIYTPTRIETSIQNIRNNKNHITGVIFSINDIFGLHQDCEVNFLLSCDEKKEEGRFKLSDEPKAISTGFNPDYMELIIADAGKVIFKEKSYFIKSIDINMSVASGNVKTKTGPISTFSSSSFSVGDHGQ